MYRERWKEYGCCLWRLFSIFFFKESVCYYCLFIFGFLIRVPGFGVKGIRVYVNDLGKKGFL